MNFDEGIVWCGRGREDSLTDHYETILTYPTYDITTAPPTVQRAYGDYRQAIDKIASSNSDLYIFCIDLLKKDVTSERISRLTAGIARQGIGQALGLILPAIDLLDSQ